MSTRFHVRLTPRWQWPAVLAASGLIPRVIAAQPQGGNFAHTTHANAMGRRVFTSGAIHTALLLAGTGMLCLLFEDWISRRVGSFTSRPRLNASPFQYAKKITCWTAKRD